MRHGALCLEALVKVPRIVQREPKRMLGEAATGTKGLSRLQAVLGDGCWGVGCWREPLVAEDHLRAQSKEKSRVELHPCRAGAALFGGRGRQNRGWPGLHMRRAPEHQVRQGNEHASRVQSQTLDTHP